MTHYSKHERDAIAATEAIGNKLYKESGARAFIDLAKKSASDSSLLRINAPSSNNPPELEKLEGALGIKLLVWFLVDSILKSAAGFRIKSVLEPMKKAQRDMTDLIGSNGSWCSVRYPIRVIHHVHEAFSALSQEISNQVSRIAMLEAENETLRQQMKALKIKSSTEISTAVRARITPDKERAIFIVAELIKSEGFKRYSSDESRRRSKRHGRLEDCGPLFYVERHIKPELDKCGLGHLSGDISIYRNIMPELYNPLRVSRYRKAKEQVQDGDENVSRGVALAYVS